MKDDEAYLVYIGKDKGALPGIPAKNLSYEEAKQFDIVKLIQSGLYQYTGEYAIKKEADQSKEQPKKTTTKKKVKHG